MIKQCAVRTAPAPKGYWLIQKNMEYLEKKLSDGWVVVMCNAIGDSLEYILQKEVKDDE